MTFVEYSLVRRVLERAFNFLKFGEIASGNIAQDDLLTKLTGVAIFDEAGLPFHNLSIPGASPTPCSRRLLDTRSNRTFHTEFR